MNLTTAIESFTIAGAPFWSFWTIFWLVAIVVAVALFIWLALKLDEVAFVGAFVVGVFGTMLWLIVSFQGVTDTNVLRQTIELDNLGYSNVELSGSYLTASDKDGNYVRAEIKQDGDTYYILKY